MNEYAEADPYSGAASDGGRGRARSGFVHRAAVRGEVGFAASGASVAKSAGTLTLQAFRTGGTDGACHALWDLGPFFAAQPGVNFVNASGRLDWADGEGGPKPITVTILNDPAQIVTLQLLVNLAQVVGADAGELSTVLVDITT